MDNLSDKDFLKNRRPEEFSSSTIVEVGTLDRVQLEYYLSTLNIRSQELEFETFAKKLCEKVVCPNLLEQTGPVAGGDGKTDTQTFPVSSQNQLLWLEGVNEQSHNERWAFAVSTQKDWKTKCKKDVKKIVETGRGYVKVFCITNQSIKADQRSKLEDELTKQYSIDVRILDLSWILDQIYKNQLEFLAINTLSIPTLYKREIELSADDYQKQKELDRLNKLITEKIDASRITTQQVDYFLEVAILSKELEKPIIDTQSLFDRAVRVAKKFGTSQQLLETSYQYAWAAHWWFEDYSLFESNLELTFENLAENTNSESWEKIVNLLTIYYGRYSYLKDIHPSVDIDHIYNNTIDVLDRLSKDLSRPSNSLMASIHLDLLQLIVKFPDEKYCIELLKKTLETCRLGSNLIGFPFEKFYNLFQELDIIFDKYEEYEELLDYFTEQSGLRDSEIKTAKLQLERGLKRLDDNKPYQAIKLLGKSVSGLNKKETYDEMTYANLLLSEAYSRVGLRWASRGSLLFSASLLANYFHKEKLILPSAIRVYWQLAWKELELGRIPQSLRWAELALLSLNAIKDDYIDEEELIRFDGCLAHLLLNCRFDQLAELEYLPDFLEKLQLFFSNSALLYILGYEDKLKEEFQQTSLDEFVKTLFLCRDTDTRHPTSQILPTLGKSITYTTRVSGCEFKIQFPNRSPYIELSESILTTIENFFSTNPIDKVFTKISSLEINIIGDDDENSTISHEFSKSSKGIYVDIFCSNFTWEHLDQNSQKIVFEWFVQFVIECLIKVYHVLDIDKFVEASFITDLSITRSIAFSTCFGATYNVMGRDSHKNVLDILNGNKGTKFELIRKLSWDQGSPKVLQNKTEKIQMGDHKKTPDFGNLESISHDQIAVTTLIKPELWDEAAWHGLAFMFFENKPPVILLIFKKEGGEDVFMDLYENLGQVDSLERLRFSIIRGVSKEEPYNYRVLLTENIMANDQHKLITMCSRIHEMTPPTDRNWSNFEKEYKKYGSYSLSFGAFFNGQFYPYPEFEKYLIKKKELVIKNAWEVGINDIEKIVLRAEDDPIVP
ncbi:hypothetical protein RFH07_17175 [Acinetobacter seifertii]|uniref:hypothetical protein n=1 Tax=Acinetobacter seifertii TaxID=1530123 RepID=UPI00168D364F|nr:hypothetical protein [Acinetobacter seifertii]MDQ9038303.1 hypothetical protein [Acinetobacter seifertii]QNY26913.1 hypothetical protein IC763_16230 [Acinetobacter seifertii]